jgi:hypothetical protein
MSQEGCGELWGIKTPSGLESWNPTLRKEREGWGTRQCDFHSFISSDVHMTLLAIPKVGILESGRLVKKSVRARSVPQALKRGGF